MPRRRQAATDPVAIFHDGDRLLAQRGESLAAALIAANRLTLARSPKLHRPRGPFCLQGGCDGCLARVNGVPSVTTCLQPARGGERIETQNALGARSFDFLAISDLLLPRGLDHHRLLAGSEPLSSLVQKIARQMAGLGRLPDAVLSARTGPKISAEVLIIGTGAAGSGAAARLAEHFETHCVDDALEPGGSSRLLDPALSHARIREAETAGATIHSATTALGLYRPEPNAPVEALVAGQAGVSRVRPRAVLIATGAHPTALAFAGNDLPGVFSARAALQLWRGGILVAERVGVLGSGRFSKAWCAETRASVESLQLEASQLRQLAGRSRVSGAILRNDAEDCRVSFDALLVDGPGAPAHELAVQAGARVAFDPRRGYVPQVDEHGKVAPGVWCAGSCVAAKDGVADGRRVASAIRRALEGGAKP